MVNLQVTWVKTKNYYSNEECKAFMTSQKFDSCEVNMSPTLPNGVIKISYSSRFKSLSGTKIESVS